MVYLGEARPITSFAYPVLFVHQTFGTPLPASLSSPFGAGLGLPFAELRCMAVAVALRAPPSGVLRAHRMAELERQSPSASPYARPEPVKRACDQCHARKCDGRETCSRCDKLSIMCTYLVPPKPRGAPPKSRQQRVTFASPLFEQQSTSLPEPRLSWQQTSPEYIFAPDSLSPPNASSRSAPQDGHEDPVWVSSLAAAFTQATSPFGSETAISPEEWAEALDVVSSWDNSNATPVALDTREPSAAPLVRMPQLGEAGPSSWLSATAFPHAQINAIPSPDLSMFSSFSSPRVPSAHDPIFSEAETTWTFPLPREPQSSFTTIGFAPPGEISPLLTLTLESLIQPQLEVFFQRVHPMIPVFSRQEIFLRIDQSGLQSREFVALILGMTALSLVHPLLPHEMPQRTTRARQATMLLDEACRLSARWDYGCAASIESVLTSYLMFGTLFELGHSAGARMRLRESISMGEAMKLDNPMGYAGLEMIEAWRRMRMYWILAVTERYVQPRGPAEARAYALQRSGHVVFEGSLHTSRPLAIQGTAAAATDDDPSSVLLRHLAQVFSFVDQDIIACWNGKCDRLSCRTFTRARAVTVLGRLKGSPADVFGRQDEIQRLSESQKADLLVTWQWVRSRIWRLAAQHDLTREGAEMELSSDYIVDVASSTVAVCSRLSQTAMEAHGAGFVEKIVDVANMIASLIRSALAGRASSEPRPNLSPERFGRWVALLQDLHFYANGHPAKNVAQIVKLSGEIESSLSQLRLLETHM